jgi:hypothetical protein
VALQERVPPRAGGYPEARLAARARGADILGKLCVDSQDLDQHLVIFRTAVICLKPPYQGERVYGTQIDLLNMFQEFEEPKHNGLHLKGDHTQSVLIR